MLPIQRSDRRAEKYFDRQRMSEWRYTWRSEIGAESTEGDDSGGETVSVKRRRTTSAVDASLNKREAVSHVVVVGEQRWWF